MNIDELVKSYFGKGKIDFYDVRNEFIRVVLVHAYTLSKGNSTKMAVLINVSLRQCRTLLTEHKITTEKEFYHCPLCDKRMMREKRSLEIRPHKCRMK